MRHLFDLFEELLNGKLPAASVSLVVKAVFLFVVAVGLIAIATAPVLSDSESIFHTSVKSFIEQPDIKADQINIHNLRVYLFSLPFKLASPLGQTGQLLAARAFGVTLLLLGLWLAYQTARRVTLENDFISLVVLALLATNNRLLFSAVTFGGDAWLFFFFTFLIYEIVEIAAKGSIGDVFLSLALIFALSKFDLFLAEKVALPILFFVIVLTILAAYKEQIAAIIPKSAQARAALGIVVITAFILAQRVSLLAVLLSTPTSLFGLINLPAWPAVIKQLVTFFSNNPNLAEGFGWAQTVLLAVFQLTALAGAAGIAWLLYFGTGQYIQVIKKAPVTVAGDGSPAGGWQITFTKPTRSIFQDFNGPALLSVALLPPTVFAANGTYAVSNILSDQNLILLTIPLTLLLAVGLRQIFTVKSLSGAFGLLFALLTFNVAVILLTILW